MFSFKIAFNVGYLMDKLLCFKCGEEKAILWFRISKGNSVKKEGLLCRSCLGDREISSNYSMELFPDGSRLEIMKVSLGE